DTDGPGIGAVDAGQDLQQCALARAVTPDDPKHLAHPHVERDISQSPELAIVRLPERMEHALFQRVHLLLWDLEGLRDPANLNYDRTRRASPGGARGFLVNRDHVWHALLRLWHTPSSPLAA